MTDIEQMRGELREEFQAERERLLDEAVAALKIVDPDTGKMIVNRTQYDEYLGNRQKKMLVESLENSGVDADAAKKLIENHPDVVKARELIAKAQRETTRVQDGEAEQKLETELSEIRKYDPAIKSAADLIALDRYKELRRFVDAKLSISEAYKAVYHDDIVAKERRAAGQEALNRVNDKRHLQADAQHGDGGATMPEAVKKQFRAAYPKLSDAELQKKYERLMPQKKG